MVVELQMDDKCESWESIRDPYEEESHTYTSFVNKSHVHNLNHGKLDTRGHYHGNHPYYCVGNIYLVPSTNTNNITKGFT